MWDFCHVKEDEDTEKKFRRRLRRLTQILRKKLNYVRVGTTDTLIRKISQLKMEDFNVETAN